MRVNRESTMKTIKPSIMARLYNMLDVGAKYRDLAESLIKRNGDDMFNADEINCLELEFKKGGSPTKTVFQRWSYERPTIGEMIQHLCSVNLIREADLIRTDVLRESPMPQPHLKEADNVDTPVREPVVNTDESVANVEMQTGMCQSFKYEDLKSCTQCFNRSLKIGSGGSCHVYKGQSQRKVFAVKIFKDVKPENIESYKKQFETEIRALSSLQHTNILTLFGYSIDGPNAGIVYEYMARGSLEDRLSCKAGNDLLTIPERLAILKGSAEGIHFIHSQNKIHRDIKSANILLTEDLVPKIGDFGIILESPTNRGKTHTVIQVVQGTYGYMAPEYYEAVVSEGLDNYAFGVIIMECLTGLPCFDPDREEKYLTTYIKETCDTEDDIFEEIDKKVGPWSNNLVIQMYRTSTKLWSARKHRPAMSLVIAEMHKWQV